MKITGFRVEDVRFPTSRDLSGSDAVHKDPDYSCVYVILETDDAEFPEGHGLTFTLGRGNEVVAACVEALAASVVVGKDFDRDIVADMLNEEDHAGFYYQLTQEGQLRWIGPEKGVVGMAAGAILNAVWDLMARRAGKPLWRYVVDMSVEELMGCIDFKHIQDFVSKEQARALLERMREGREERIELMETRGFRAYTTSCGWLGYSHEVIRQKCKESLASGHRYFKMKVGSRNVQEDIERARVIREEIGDDNFLMMANQKWGVNEAVENMKLLAEFKPLWIEEPTNCDDVVGHATIASGLKGIAGGFTGVATGEACSNKVLFKQLLQQNAIRYCQIDSCRVAGLSEVLSILLMAAHAGVKVAPHAGGVGLCEYVRHLAMIDFVCFNGIDELDRVCESISDTLQENFYDKVDFNHTKDGLFYKAPVRAGYAEMKQEGRSAHAYPRGEVWKDDADARAIVGSELDAARALLKPSFCVKSAMVGAAAALAGATFLSFLLGRRRDK